MASSCQVQLVCLDAALAIASAGRQQQAQMQQQQQRLALIPTLLELLFYTPCGLQDPSKDHGDHQRFLSYVETQHEISLVFEAELLHRFPPGVLEYEPLRWKALQVASAGPGAFLSQLAVLTQLTTELARQHISVFQISTYQSDYVLVKVEDLKPAIACLQRFCSIEMESGEELHISSDDVQAQGLLHAYIDAPEGETEASDEDQQQDVHVHQHPLSVPSIELHLVQLDRTFVRRHLFSLVQLLFNDTEGDELEDEASPRFLSYSETGDDISVVTSDPAFLAEAKELEAQGDQGVLVSPDFWRPVQIGNSPLGFVETGIVAGQTRVLVNAGTMVFYLSTYATDFMLIKDDEWADALPLLRRHFSVSEGSFAALTT